MAAGEDQPQPVVGHSGSASSSSSRSSERGSSRSRPSRTSFFSSSVRARRKRSIALFRATRVIQAPGLSGIPSRGQRSSATTNASWTASSAASKSPEDADQTGDRPSRLVPEQAVDSLGRALYDVAGVAPASAGSS